ncbi:MAG TPA: hypothetical protein VGF38_23410 [Ktedonobacterales bacterium]|jgi:hypothetical protein
MHDPDAPKAPTPPPPTVDLYDQLTMSIAAQPTNAEPEWVARYWVVLLWLVPAAGVLTLALADTSGRASSDWADPLYWLGLCLIYLPAVARVFIGGQIGRSEGLSAVLIVAFGFSLVRILAYPTGYALNDEFQHLRTLQDILASNHLFSPNPILPVSPAFPGLELPTDALIKLTGLPDFVASMCVIVLAKQLLTLALFLTFERVARSTRFATIGTLIYLANPTVLYDDGQFAYEILGLALAALSLYLLVCATTRQGAARVPYLVLAIPAAVALVVTHHVSGLIFVAFILFWAVIEPRFDNGLGSWRVPIIALVVILPMMILWYVVVANVVWWYLAPFPAEALSGLINVLSGAGQSRSLFSHVGTPVPLWEQLAIYGAVAITAGGLIYGWMVAVQRHRLSGLGKVFALAAMAYFASLALHFVPTGLAGATRLMGWALIPAGFLLALDVVVLTRAGNQPMEEVPPQGGLRGRLRGITTKIKVFVNTRPRMRTLVIPLALTLACGVILLGDISTDAGFPWFHTPGPFLMEGDARGITQEGISSATWMNGTLGPGYRLATDTENSLLFATYGAQFPIVAQSPIFTNPQYDAQVQQIIATQHIQYLVVDLRMSRSLPAQGSYFGSGGQEAEHTTPLAQAALVKFNSVVGIDLVYDSGDLLIYRVG